VHYLLLAFHWNACLFHLVYRKSGFGGPPSPSPAVPPVDGGQQGLFPAGSDNSAWSDMRYPVPGDSVMTYLMSYYW